MADTAEQFLNKLDTSAEGLEPTEQAMLAYLIADVHADDVVGFNGLYCGWPVKIADLAPIKVVGLFSGPSGTGKTLTARNVVTGGGSI